MENGYLPAVSIERRSRRLLSLRRVRVSAATRERLLYAGAAVSYVGIGVFVTEVALSWVVFFAWLLVWVWGLPALLGRLRR